MSGQVGTGGVGGSDAGGVVAETVETSTARPARVAGDESGVERAGLDLSSGHVAGRRDRVSIGRALSLDEEAEVIVRCLRGEITRAEAAAEMDTAVETVRRRTALFIAAGAKGLKQSRSRRPVAGSGVCADVAAHALGDAMVRLEVSRARATLGVCDDPALHALGAGELARAREERGVRPPPRVSLPKPPRSRS